MHGISHFGFAFEPDRRQKRMFFSQPHLSTFPFAMIITFERAALDTV